MGDEFPDGEVFFYLNLIGSIVLCVIALGAIRASRRRPGRAVAGTGHAVSEPARIGADGAAGSS